MIFGVGFDHYRGRYLQEAANLIIVGVDPGQTGGVVGLDETGGILWAYVMPEDGLLDLDLQVSLHWVFVEKAQSFPKQGIASAFNYGVHFGTLLGTVAAKRLRHQLVPPRAWTKMMHVGTAAGEPKTRSLEAAKRVWPAETWLAPGTRQKKPHMGIVDAALIAEYGRRQVCGGSREP